MALVLTQLNPIGGQSRAQKKGSVISTPSLWAYGHASDNLAAIKATGYFNDARGLLSPGDIIMFSANGAAVDIVTINAVPSDSTVDVTMQATDINSA